MASSSHQRSSSSGRSNPRKQVHVGTGARSRTISAHPHVQVEGNTERAAGRTPGGRPSRAAVPSSRRAVNPTILSKRQERERKRRAQLMERLKRVALVVGAVLALSVLISTVRNAEVFRITSVEVTGTTRVDVAAVREMADIPPDATVFTVSEDDVRARLVLDPWIEDAQLARRLPSTLVIELVERVPAAVVDTGTEFWWVDAQGVVLGAASLDTTATTVMVRGIPDFEPVAGERSTSETLSNALAVLKGISPELRAGVRSVSAPALLETALITDGGVEVMIGEAMRLEEKSQLALRILAEEGEDVVFVDVRSLERPISRGLDDD